RSRTRSFRIRSIWRFGTLWLAPRLGRLYEQYPNLQIDLILNERVLDLPMREADLAIRMKEPSQADLIRRRLMDVQMRFFASRDYAQRWGVPTNEEELLNHRIIGFSPDAAQVTAGAEWLQPYFARHPYSRLTVNNYFGILQSVLNGLGIGALPDYLAIDNPDLVPVLTEARSRPVPVYLAYPAELRQSKRVEAFRDFMLAEIAEYRRARRSALEAMEAMELAPLPSA
ncbi:MAG: substrate binding domain-containing protein, partial [Pseudomonadota bacterium]